MTTVEATNWLERLGQDIARADANSLRVIRAQLAEVAGDDPDTAVAGVVEQLRAVRGHITAMTSSGTLYPRNASARDVASGMPL